jgi:hypothetical protein
MCNIRSPVILHVLFDLYDCHRTSRYKLQNIFVEGKALYFRLFRENIERANTGRCLCYVGMIHDSIKDDLTSFIKRSCHLYTVALWNIS